MYHRILVATGGSPWSDGALTTAVALAACTGAELCVVTVFVTHGMYTTPDGMGGAELVVADIVEREGQSLLARAVAQALEAGVACETVSGWGNVADTILRTAVETHADLIVLGSRGVSGWKRLMLGNIANIVAAKAPQPVLVVKQPAVPDAPLGRRLLVANGKPDTIEYRGEPGIVANDIKIRPLSDEHQKTVSFVDGGLQQLEVLLHVSEVARGLPVFRRVKPSEIHGVSPLQLALFPGHSSRCSPTHPDPSVPRSPRPARYRSC